jgi:hypothetical protein
MTDRRLVTATIDRGTETIDRGTDTIGPMAVGASGILA